MKFLAHDKQADFLQSRARVKGAFSGRRGGKTEVGAIETIIRAERQDGYDHESVDDYLLVVIAPTYDMVRRLSLAKLLGYSKGRYKSYHQTHQEITWHNGTKIIGISADKPARLEGLKASGIWIDEVFQCPEQIFTESLARLADTKGSLWVTGSLGVQYTNPKTHWVYKHFIEKPIADSEYFVWSTADNPYFPQDEIERLKDTLDPRTFRQLFEIDWTIPATGAVYSDFDEINVVRGYQYDPRLETTVAVDWGWTHDMACGFFQYDPRTRSVVLFDEIVKSRMTIQQLYEAIQAKPYKIQHYYCDAAGTQEREAMGKSNIAWFREKGIHFRYRRTRIVNGISLVRQWVMNGKGERHFFIDEVRCPKSLDGMRSYAYPEKDGVITDELPVKKADDCVDMIRYYFVNRHDKAVLEPSIKQADRWGKQWQF